MTKYLIAYGATALLFFVADFIWLTTIARPMYLQGIGQYLREQPAMGAAAAFYALYVVGIVFFAVNPALEAQSALKALLFGAAFGFFAYATYDVTNYATIKDWPITMSVIDTLWGTVLTGMAAFGGYHLTRLVSG